MQTIRWGILGPGAISRKFATDLRLAAGAETVAVGSRDRDRAADFAAEFGIPHAHGSYESLVGNPRVDAIYVGTPHAFHAEHALLCLRHGKHVLCEKSLALNAGQAERMARAARENDLLLMEAMWTRFLPAVVRLRQLLAEGVIGEPRLFMADFGFRTEFDPTSRLFAPALGGGTLLDLGVYPVSFASMLFGAPTEIGGLASLGRSRVDEEATIDLRHGGGELATAALSFRVDTPREGVVLGTGGRIRLHRPWWGATRLSIHRADGAEEILDFPLRGYGYEYEAEEFMTLIREGRRDSAIMPLQESLAIMRTMDALRA
ncbi:MAG: Gfo/Idh/MocA family oxidoreductase, partial [marine benthic group bacterium]|nr:Gfo/Idh/MocA family oxidoreductase [Gemmatimonadota bacterium]